MNGIKSWIKNITPLYNCYLYIFRRQQRVQLKREKNFFAGIIQPGALVYDIGANVGNKTSLFSNLGAQVVAVEPDPTNYGLLTKRFQNHRTVKLFNGAVSDKTGITDFFINEPGSAYNTLSTKWKDTLMDPDANRWHSKKQFDETVSLDHLLQAYGKPHYIKIDVEGHELECIRGLSQRVDIISFEANLPEFREETLKILDHLKGLDASVTFNYQRSEPRFESSAHLGYDAFYDFMATTDIRFMEIFSFMNKQ